MEKFISENVRRNDSDMPAGTEPLNDFLQNSRKIHVHQLNTALQQTRSTCVRCALRGSQINAVTASPATARVNRSIHKYDLA